MDEDVYVQVRPPIALQGIMTLPVTDTPWTLTLISCGVQPIRALIMLDHGRQIRVHPIEMVEDAFEISVRSKKPGAPRRRTPPTALS